MAGNHHSNAIDIKGSYQVRGVPGRVFRSDFEGRRVDFWAPIGGSDHLLVAHDGQNIFDRRTATHHRTWRMAQCAISVSSEMKIAPPVIIAVFNGSTPEDPMGRGKELAPEKPFRSGIPVFDQVGDEWKEVDPFFPVDQLRGDAYLHSITEKIVPTIATHLGHAIRPENTAMVGSSMGGLATIYALGERPDFYTTGLAFSTHWPIGQEALVQSLIERLPHDGAHRLWMSIGTKGHDAFYGPLQAHADKLLKERGWHQGSKFQSHTYHRTGHYERSWASFLPQALRFWLG